MYVITLGVTSAANCTKQNTGKPTTYYVAGFARAQGDTGRRSLIQVKGVPLLVPIR